jgi:small acid-soluble spore protein D (minor alpha/beta-type SASP)
VLPPEEGCSLGRRNNRPVNPAARQALDNLKYEVAQELGYMQGGSENELRESLDRMKFEAAEELGLTEKIRTIGWPNMTSRECGKVGGRLGGRLGGQMVRRMIEFAETHMANNSR